MVGFKIVSISLPPNLFQKIKTIQDQLGLGMSEFYRYAVISLCEKFFPEQWNNHEKTLPPEQVQGVQTQFQYWEQKAKEQGLI